MLRNETIDSFIVNDSEMYAKNIIPLHECAFFSNHVYQDTFPLLPGWSILYSIEDATGYKGNIYVKDLLTETAKVVIAHRGTVPTNTGDMLNNIDYVLGKVPSQCSSMFYYIGQEGFRKLDIIYDEDPTFPKNYDHTTPYTEDNPKLKYISYVSTGHSLGGLLSDCFTALTDCTFQSVTFENPGSKLLARNVLTEMLRLPENLIAERLNKMRSICQAYQAGVNAINTCQEQAGRTFRFQKLDYQYTLNSLGLMAFPPSHTFASDFTFLVGYTLDQHSMEKISVYVNQGRSVVEISNPVGIHEGYIQYVNPQNKDYWDGYLEKMWSSPSVLAEAMRLKYADEKEFITHGYQLITLVYEELLKHRGYTAEISRDYSLCEVVNKPVNEKMFYPELCLFNSWQFKTDKQVIKDFVLVDKKTFEDESQSRCTII